MIHLTFVSPRQSADVKIAMDILEYRLPSPTELFWMRKRGSAVLQAKLGAISFWVHRFWNIPRKYRNTAMAEYVKECKSFVTAHPFSPSATAARYEWDVGKLDYFRLLAGYPPEIYGYGIRLRFLQVGRGGSIDLTDRAVYGSFILGAPMEFAVTEEFTDAEVLVRHGLYDFGP